MFNLLNKSVKTINSGISSLVSGITGENSFKTEVDFCKFDVLNLNMLNSINKEKETLSGNIYKNDSDNNLKEFNVFYIVYSKTNLNIYLITDDLELKCIFSQKMNFVINSVDTLLLPINTTYTKELPIIVLISNPLHINNGNTHGNSTSANSEVKNASTLLMKCESHLKLFSLKSKRVIHNFRFKKKILHFISKMNFFAIGFADGSIKLYENDKMRNFWTINTDGNGIEKVREKIKTNFNKNLNRANKNLINSNSNLNNSNSSYNHQIGNTTSNANNYNSLTHTLLSSSLSNNFNFKQNSSSTNLLNNTTINNNNSRNIFSNYYMYMNPIFDLSDTFIIYFNNSNDIQNNDLTLKKENSANLNLSKDLKIEKEFTNCNLNASSKYENLINSYSTTGIINNYESSKRISNNSNSNSNHGSDSSYKKVNKYSKSTNNYTNTNNLKTIKNDLAMKTLSPNKLSSSSSHNSQFENISAEVYTNISKLKDWSVSQVKDLYNLRNATNLKNNKEVSLSKTDDSNNLFPCSITLQKIIFEDNLHLKLCEERESRDGNNLNSNLNSNKINHNKNFSNEFGFLSNYLEKIKSHSTRISIPFFEDGISTLKFLNNNRYIIVGNKNSQMFFIYEIFPQSNLKFTSNIESPQLHQVVSNSILKTKIIYSIYRGMTSAKINALDLSTCKNFMTLASNKGTFHIFNLPKRDNQLIENTLNFDYKNFDKLNQKVICAKDFDKIKYKDFLYNYTYKSSCVLMNLNKIDVDKNFTNEMRETILKSKFSKHVKGSILCTYAENESAIHFYYLNKNYKKTSKPSDASYLMKKSEILSSEDKEEAERNYESIKKGKILNNLISYNNNFSGNKSRTSYKENIEMETTEKNFSILHKNPFFTFNVVKNLNSNSNNQNYQNSNSNSNSNKNSLNKVKQRISMSSSSNISSHNNNVFTSKLLASKNAVIEERSESEFSPSSSIDAKSVNKLNNFILNFNNNINCNNNKAYIHLSICNVSTFSLHSSQVNKQGNPISNSRRSNSIQIKFNSNLNIINNYYGNSNINPSVPHIELVLYERLICQDNEYIPKSFNNTDRRILPKNDFTNENYLQPKLIVYPNNFNSQNTNKIKTMCHLNNTSENSSANNSSSLNGVNVNCEQGLDNEGNNVNSFFKNKENLLENQLRIAIETSINDSLNKKNEVVKMVEEFKIDDNYYMK